MRFFFDFIIILTLAFSGYWIFWISRTFFIPQTKNPRTKLVRGTVLFVLLLIFVCVFWGAFIEPRLIRLTRVNLDLGQTETHEQIKIAFIADTHLGPFKKTAFMEKVARKISAENPDVILLGGDYILFKEEYAAYLAPLASLAAKYPTFAVTGNHEYNQGFNGDTRYKDKTGLLRQLCEQWGIKLLENANETVQIRDAKFVIAGITDIWTGRADLNTAGQNTDSLPAILLAHNPEAALYSGAEKFNLILAGHTHAGQLRLPFIGALAYPDNVSRQFTYGLYQVANNWLLVTAGLGESGGLRMRFYDRPEIALLTVDL